MESQTTQNKTQQSNALLYILIAIIIILLGYIGYIYSSKDMVKKGTLKSDYVLKNSINFGMLPTYEKDKYVEYYEYSDKIEQLNNEITSMKRKNKVVYKSEMTTNREMPVVNKIINKIPEESKMIEHETVYAENKTENKFENEEDVKMQITAKSYDTFTCKDLLGGSVDISAACINQLHAFLDKNKNAKIFEVIGMVDNSEFKLIKKLKDVYGEKKLKSLSKYSQIGLSRQRVIEASWAIREYIGDYKNIKTVNYTVKSKNKKGFVVRAYQ